ncbi:uncharacterized protein BDCG_09094 [Blastomyces dermatitidis ER-3]|uniref:Uncharacterized protein n=1 Tax=Ajellomyces dermatitidis (strain ER-3 / ATCC MYA-2586) TaxID=559297 RepID=A0ABP2EQE7_AJEDR|nr:uncharacterized protein BDCG_09094 [Blastomyces dermatitidis ER-3]EEQ85825.2 hypothetical protein BDCG_09094 [Blastomyces dermatitidis ER-3]
MAPGPNRLDPRTAPKHRRFVITDPTASARPPTRPPTSTKRHVSPTLSIIFVAGILLCLVSLSAAGRFETEVVNFIRLAPEKQPQKHVSWSSDRHYWTLKQHHPCSAVTQIRILQAPYKRREENDVAILIEMDPWTGPTTVTPKKYRHCASSVAAFVCDDGGGQDLMASRQPYLDGFHHFKLGRWWGKQV